MKAIISTTFDDKYLFFLPIVSWCWNKLGIETICFLPSPRHETETEKLCLAIEYYDPVKNHLKYFIASEHKAATYAQCSRLYAAALYLPEDEILITSDVDMALFQIPKHNNGCFAITGYDLTPTKQFPICYISAQVEDWRKAFDIGDKTYQECLDELLGHIEAQHFRGNFWSKDQETAFNVIAKDMMEVPIELIPRTNGQNQFATKRVDRDDAYWRDRLNLDVIDAHLWRPGFEENNFKNILELLRYFYPNDNFDWLIEYRNKYVELL